MPIRLVRQRDDAWQINIGESQENTSGGLEKILEAKYCARSAKGCPACFPRTFVFRINGSQQNKRVAADADPRTESGQSKE